MKTAKIMLSLMLVCAPGLSLWAQSSKPELKSLSFAALDANKDGKLSAAEARSDADLYASFASLDVNQDGFLSPDEFSVWPRAQRTSAASSDPTTTPGGSSGAQHMPSN